MKRPLCLNNQADVNGQRKVNIRVKWHRQGIRLLPFFIVGAVDVSSFKQANLHK
jgi:hypothetical protein